MAVKLLLKQWLDSLHLTEGQFFALVGALLIVSFAISRVFRKKGPVVTPAEPEPQPAEESERQRELPDFAILIRNEGSSPESASLLDKEFQKAFNLALQYHGVKEDICMHNFHLDEGDSWFEYSQAHEQFVTFLKKLRTDNVQLTGSAEKLLPALNQMASALFSGHLAARLVATNEEALSRPKQEVRGEIDRYFSRENQQAKRRQLGR